MYSMYGLKKSFALFRLHYLLFIAAMSLTIACQGAPLLPTRAVPAAVDLPAEEVVVINGLPVTWTPAPAERAVDGAAEFMPLGPTAVPSETPRFPTSTPYPTVTPTPSPTILPTATPLNFSPPVDSGPAPPPVAGNYPPIDNSRSKLGLHVIRNDDANILNFHRLGQPAIIKALDDFGYLAEIKRVSPRTVIIGRLNYVDQNYGGTPEEAARRFVNVQLDQYQKNPAVDYWEGWNEPDPGLARMAWYARFEQERVRLLHRYGFKAAVGGFATGVPEMDEFALFLPAIETAKQYGGILSLHEYGAPDMTYLYGGALPGYPAYPDRGALTFRYRWYYREFLEPAGLVIPLAITEAGIDGIIGNRPGPTGFGWADFQEYWVQNGWGATGIEAFINQLAWYDAGVRQDSYVIGFTIFTAGPIGHWKRYDINPILPQLTDYVRSQG